METSRKLKGYLFIASAFIISIGIQDDAEADQRKNVTLLGKIDASAMAAIVNGLADPLPANYIYDVWGCTDVQNGKEYGLLCHYGTNQDGGQIGGLRVIDVTDPRNPDDKVLIVAPRVADVKVYEESGTAYAYLARETGDILIVDLQAALSAGATNHEIEDDEADWASVVVGSIPASQFGRAHNVFVSDGVLYIATMVQTVYWYNLNGNPKLQGVIGPDGSFTLTGYGASPKPHDIYVSGTRAYVSYYNVGVTIATLDGIPPQSFTNPVTYNYKTDRANPSDPDLDHSDPNILDWRGTHNAWATDDGQYVFTTDEYFGGVEPSENDRKGDFMKIWDFSDTNNPLKAAYEVDPANPVPGHTKFSQIGLINSSVYDTTAERSIHNVHVDGDYAYVSYYDLGVRIVDITSPASPKEAGYYRPDNIPRDVVTFGFFGVYPFDSRSNLFYTSGNLGFYVFLFGWTGSIAANTTWSDDVYVRGDVTVSSGVTLTITQDTKIRFDANSDFESSGANSSKCELIVNGALNVQGQPGYEVLFQPTGTAGAWYGIQFNSGSSGSISYASIDYATKGIFVDEADVTVTDSNIRFFSEQGIYALSPTSLVVDGSVVGPGQGASHGLYLFGYSTPIVRNSDIGNVPIGVEVATSSGAIASIHDNDIHDCSNAGIKVYQSKPDVFDNLLRANQYGIRLATSSNPDIHDNDIYSNSTGVYLEQSEPSRLKWNNFGYTSGQISENADWGMVINSLSSGNGFADNKANNFYDGSVTRDVRNFTTVTFMARGNYWDDQTIVGPADASSPLSSPNPDAGPGGAQGKLAESGWQASPQKVEVVPTRFRLEPNFPNPFNPSTVIRFALPEEAVVTVTILDIGGRVVRRLLLTAPYAAGTHEVMWDGRDDSGEVVASGVYFYRMEALTNAGDKQFTDSRKLVFIR